MVIRTLSVFAQLVLFLGVQSPPAAPDEAELRAVASAYLSTQEREDLEAHLALWVATGEGVDRRRKDLPVVFQFGADRFTNVRIDRIRIDGERTSVRIVADRERTVVGGNTIPSRQAIILECVRTADGWRVAAETSAYGALADDLLALEDPTALDQRLDADRDLLNRDLLRAVAERADKRALAREFERALAGYTLLKELARRMIDIETASGALQNIGNTYFFRQNYAGALEIYQERLALEEKRGNPADIAVALQAVASGHYALNDYVAALEFYKRALAIVESGSKDDRSIATIATSVGNVYLLQGDYAAAVEFFTRSRALFDELKGYPADAGRAFHGEGRAETARGNFNAAVAALDTAVLRFQEARDRPGVAQALASLGYATYLRGDHERAVGLYEECLALEQSLDNAEGVARILQSIGLVELVRGRFKEAVDAYTHSRTEYEKLENVEGRAFATLGLGFARTATGELDLALIAYREASAAFEALGRAEQVGRAALGTSMAHAARRAPQESLDAATRAASVGRKTESRDLEWRARVREGYALIALERLAEARSAFEKAVSIVEDPSGPDHEEPGAPIDDDRASPHAGLAEALILLNDPAGALVSAERARLRRLRDQLNRVRDLINAGMTESEQERERRFARLIVSLRSQVDRERRLPKPDMSRIATLRERLARATADRDEFTTRLYERLPELARWRGDIRAGEIDAAAARSFDPGTVVLSFTVSENRVFAIAGRRGDAPPAAIALPGSAKEIHERPETIVSALRPLVAGVAAVVIVPEGFLWRMPFESLGADGTSLFGSARLSYAGSLTLLARLDRAAPIAEPALMAIGSIDPASPFYSVLRLGERPPLELRELFTQPVAAPSVQLEEPPATEPGKPIDDAAHAVQWAFAAARVHSVKLGRLNLEPQSSAAVQSPQDNVRHVRLGYASPEWRTRRVWSFSAADSAASARPRPSSARRLMSR
ncbi:MAG TPA: tetratricopeptide repeat protein [Vicinamibacterales bacterium]|nr:tetratricopeptide repeat protein [Vicinamibacterales bacterium]